MGCGSEKEVGDGRRRMGMGGWEKMNKKRRNGKSITVFF